MESTNRVKYVMVTSWGMRRVLHAATLEEAIKQFDEYVPAPHNAGCKKTLVTETVTTRVLKEGKL